MIQGRKKPGSKGEDGGSSIWGKPFADEFDDRLTHTGPGIVSMANSGPATNGRQFFITYKSCSHLNRKHSVFGKVAGGLEILRRLEEVPTDKHTDRPLETIRIEKMEILENPVAEALEIERKRILKKKEEKRQSDRSLKAAALGGSSSPSKTAVLPSPKAVKEESGPSPIVIGKYLKTAKKESKKRAKQSKSEAQAGAEESAVSRLPPPPKKTSFSDFSGW